MGGDGHSPVISSGVRLFVCKTCGEENADRNASFNIAYRALAYISKVGVTVNTPITLASTGRSTMMTRETRKRVPVYPVVVHSWSSPPSFGIWSLLSLNLGADCSVILFSSSLPNSSSLRNYHV